MSKAEWKSYLDLGLEELQKRGVVTTLTTPNAGDSLCLRTDQGEMIVLSDFPALKGKI